VNALRWLIGLRLVVISAFFLGALIIQASTRMILPISGLYALFLLSYCLSLAHLGLYLKGISTRIQAAAQLVGDIAIVTGFVYVTGGLYSPFSFLYLTVIVVGAVLLRGGGLIFAGLSAVSYGVLVDLMAFHLIPVPPNMVGMRVVLPTSRVLYQLLIHIVGFILVALLVSYLSESLRTAHSRLLEETERASQFAALTDHVVRSVGAGILATDLEGKVVHVNPAGARILKLSNPDDTVGKLADEVIALDGKPWSLLWSRARRRAIHRIEASHASTGTRLGLSVGPLEDEGGALVGFVINFQDLSELQIELEQRRLQERMAAVGELASRMAHEIKNPLASISGSAQMLASVGSLDVTERRLLDIVVDESRRLSGILDGFLNFARPSHTARKPCDIAALLRDCMDLLEGSEETSERHELLLEAPDELVIPADEPLLRQVFWNLARNALQAMPDGGRLVVSAQQRGDSVLLHWSDSGCGMSNELRQRAFEPFVTSQPGGSGLGLAVVYAAVAEHGGSVDIDSSTGVGTTVTVELPRHNDSMEAV
jgi:two-component system sensor histidine kinase PilS (NtrC family)